MTLWHPLLHDLERAMRAISGLAGFLYLCLGVFMQNTDQGLQGPSNPATTALHYGECNFVSKIPNDNFNLGKQFFFVKANFIAVKCGFLVFQYTFAFTVFAGYSTRISSPRGAAPKHRHLDYSLSASIDTYNDIEKRAVGSEP
jgi:hypothetical protein